ncbi:Leucine-rich repeat and IQ domain-containing protein 3 [Varanus komodoensis]|nr:Leucine-rich repeat and IQ domain-containing protein 3 [Varanus komodoensis]
MTSLHSFHDIFRYKCYNKDGTKQMYIQHRPSLHSSKSCTFHTIKPKQDNEEKIHASGIQAIDVKDLKDLHFYLRSLKQPILSTILRLEEKKRIKENKSRKSSRKDLLEWKKTEKKEDTMAAKFRLSIHRTPFYSLTEDLQQYHEKEKYFFDAVQDLRYITHSIPQTMPIHEPGSIEKKVFAKAFGSIRLRPLCSIDKTYWESQRLDGQLKKEREVMRMLIEKSDAHDYIDRLREEKIEKLQKKYEEEKLKIRDILKDSKHEQSKLINKMREKYSRYLDNKERKVLENAFVQRFSTQHTSLTRGLLRLDGWRNCREAVSEKKYRNKGIVEEQKQRKEVYQHFHEERVQMLQKQNKNEKKIRKCVAHEMSKEQFKQSKAKVEAVKKPGVKILCTLPVIGSSGTAVPVVEYDD